jgi:hypothetical protein
LFRYIRYSDVGLRRPALQRTDETPTTLAEVKLETPRRAKRFGTLDPETSLIIWQDEVVDATGVTALRLETSPADPAPVRPGPQMEGA